MRARAEQIMKESAELKAQCAAELAGPIADAAALVVSCFRGGGKVLLFGNGGSAADAQHIAAEFINKFFLQRPALPAIALTTDTSALTSIGNDESFEVLFSRQVEGLCKTEDLVIGISTSGNSPNVLRGLQAARQLGAKTIALAGRDGGPVAEAADLAIVVPHQETSRIQEVHITVGHILCDLVDREMYGTPAPDSAVV